MKAFIVDTFFSFTFPFEYNLLIVWLPAKVGNGYCPDLTLYTNFGPAEWGIGNGGWNIKATIIPIILYLVEAGMVLCLLLLLRLPLHLQ